MNLVAFIDTKYIKDNSPILGYVSDDELSTFIQPAQDMYLERVLGTKLMNRLKTSIINDNVSADEKTLLDDYISPTLMYWVIFQYILWSNYKMTNKATSKQNSDNSNPSELNEVNYLKSNISDWAEYYSTRLTSYIKDNTASFPEYNQGSDGYSELSPDTNHYIFGGMYIPDHNTVYPGKTPWDSIRLYW